MSMRKTIPPELEGEYVIRVMDLPVSSKGFVIYDDDDFANVYINARMNNETQHIASDHEIDHMIYDDIHNNDDIRTIEARADGKAIPVLPAMRRASELPRPGKRHDKEELKIKQERFDDWKNDWYVNAPLFDEY